MLAAFGVASAPAGAAPPEKVVICHATKARTNPYQENEVNSNAIHGDHGHGRDTGPVFDYAHPAANVGWGDIIPPFEGFEGLNWDADGQTIHGAHCTPVEIDLCEFDPELSADDPACGEPVVPGVCEFDPELSADDPACGEPVVPGVCEFDPELSADDPACGEPVVPGVCEFDPELSADDPACGEPVVPEVCEFDPKSADDRSPRTTPPALHRWGTRALRHRERLRLATLALPLRARVTALRLRPSLPRRSQEGRCHEPVQRTARS